MYIEKRGPTHPLNVQCAQPDETRHLVSLLGRMLGLSSLCHKYTIIHIIYIKTIEKKCTTNQKRGYTVNFFSLLHNDIRLIIIYDMYHLFFFFYSVSTFYTAI